VLEILKKHKKKPGLTSSLLSSMYYKLTTVIRKKNMFDESLEEKGKPLLER